MRLHSRISARVHYFSQRLYLYYGAHSQCQEIAILMEYIDLNYLNIINSQETPY